MTILVAMRDGRPLLGAEVSLVTNEGIQPFGKTDRLGAAEVPLKILEADHVFGVLFCHEWFFCGFIRADGGDIVNYREKFITLAPLAVR